MISEKGNAILKIFLSLITKNLGDIALMNKAELTLLSDITDEVYRPSRYMLSLSFEF